MQLNKNLIILIIILAVVLVAGFFTYKYFFTAKPGDNVPANEQNQQNIENIQENSGEEENPLKVEMEVGGVKTEGGNGGGGLIICADKCGDGICQKSDPNCKTGDMNCVCPESPQDCPQDCK